MTNTKKIFEILSKDKLKVIDLLHIQYMAGERIVPIDVVRNEYEKHPSESLNENIDILDMDLTHLIRSYSKSLETKPLKNNENLSEIGDLLTDADRAIHKIRKML